MTTFMLRLLPLGLSLTALLLVVTTWVQPGAGLTDTQPGAVPHVPGNPDFGELPMALPPGHPPIDRVPANPGLEPAVPARKGWIVV